MFQATTYHRCQAGTTLIEVLIALLVLSFGMLGIAALQVRAIKNANSAVVRGNFSQINVAFGESLTANRNGARVTTNSQCPLTQIERDLAASDYDNYWFGTFPLSTRFAVKRTGTACTPGVPHQYLFGLGWNDSRAVGGAGDTRIGLYYEF